ncbi:MAG: metallophosphoesterase family protein [Verrucomicrobia bacterium]|nr:metallophosphoesterase family protein [Verrucomicrobiota bacterium]
MSFAPAEPILILSDLHLGHRASRIKAPDQLLDVLSASKSVIFNGDTAEMRHTEDRPIGRKLAAELARVCHQIGTRSFFINGNHDPTISNTNHFDLVQGAVLVTHGDILFLGVAPWSREAKHYLKKHQQILTDLGPDAFNDFEKRLLASKRTALELQMIEEPLTPVRTARHRFFLRQLWPPKRLVMIAKAWLETPEKACDLGRVFRPQARFIIVGHTHYPGVWKQSPRIVINTGSFIPYFEANAVLIENGRLTVHKIESVAKKFVLGKKLAHFAIARMNAIEGY